MTKIRAFTEGNRVPTEIELEYAIRYLNLPINKSNELSLDFVGIVIRNENPLIVFPKHFPIETAQVLRDSQLLIRVLRKSKNTSGLGKNRDVRTFPLDSYLFICDYFRKFGLYMESERIIKQGYKGRINWQHTIAKSNKVLNQGNIIFMPFMLEKTIDQSVLLTTCMEEVLSHGYNCFGRFLEIGVKYKISREHFNSYQMKQLIKQLKLLRAKYFKDVTLKLITAFINYFEWASSTGSEVHLVTTNFEIVWEEMIQHYLNTHFHGVDTSRKPHEIIFKSTEVNSYPFHHKMTAPVLQNHPIGRSYKLEYDHISHNEESNELFLMDAKYYEKIIGLNYKQVVYSYFILEENNNKKKFGEKVKLVNGLILPTEKNYYSKTHINRENIDGVIITEHYFNILDVMKVYIN